MNTLAILLFNIFRKQYFHCSNKYVQIVLLLLSVQLLHGWTNVIFGFNSSYIYIIDLPSGREFFLFVLFVPYTLTLNFGSQLVNSFYSRRNLVAHTKCLGPFASGSLLISDPVIMFCSYILIEFFTFYILGTQSIKSLLVPYLNIFKMKLDLTKVLYFQTFSIMLNMIF